MMEKRSYIHFTSWRRLLHQEEGTNNSAQALPSGFKVFIDHQSFLSTALRSTLRIEITFELCMPIEKVTISAPFKGGDEISSKPTLSRLCPSLQDPYSS